MVEAERIDGEGFVVSADRDERLYLITKRKTIYGDKTEIVPFEQMPLEERLVRTVGMLGKDVSEVVKSMTSSKKEKVKEIE